MKRLPLGLVASVLVFGATGAHAAGYFNAVDKNTYEGWACNPSTPGYSGWIHLWRDDGKVIGAIHANNQRESAVGSICGDSGVHGFQGTVSFPADYLDNAWHTVRAYFINEDGTSFELQNSVNVLFDGGPQPYVFNYQTSPACSKPSPFDALPGYLLYSSPRSFSECNSSPRFDNPLTYVYVGDPAIPVGTETEFCADPSSTSKLPSNWQVVGNGTNGECLKSANWSQVGNNPPVFGNFTYYQRLKIRKVQ
ncbi:hypothetical protein [Paracidovorax avenae]|uniref:hypothetical protein n=1 Tax=Paracidovorax avenae TaxID=80867 RepID=UPI001AD80A46|nr:hypothetical protein [Paracidovorax avenae]